MAGDEPSEDAEAGADGDEAVDGDPGGDSASDEPTAGDAPEDASPTGEPTEDPTEDPTEHPTDDSHGPVDDRESAEVETAEAADDTDADEPKGTTGHETATDDDRAADQIATYDEAVEAEAEALVEEMEAAVEESGPVEASDAGGDHAGGEPDDDEALEDEPAAEPPDDESIPMAPDHEVDPDVDPPAPREAEDVEVGADAEADVADSPGRASPMVDDVDEPDELDEPDVSEGVFGGARSGPAEDREMPLADHIREMLKRLAVVVAVAGFVSLLVFPFAEEIINFLWYSILPGVESDIARPRLYGVLELVFTELKVASLAGLIVALPVMVYETYAFMRPGLYPHERRYYLAAVPTSLVLAIVGVAFAYFVVLPSIFVYFLYYSQDVATIGFALGRTFDLILLMMAYLAVVFQIPLFIMLAMMMGLVTRRWLAERRLLFWGAFLGISFLFSFDPTGMAPIIVAATMIVLFEGTLLLTKWTGRE